MKKFSEWVEMVREAELLEKSELQKSYQDYFQGKLDKFGVKSPADLSDEKKKEFFNEIAKEWEAGKGVKESYIKEGEVKAEKPAKNEAGGNNFNPVTDKAETPTKEGGVKKADAAKDEEKAGQEAKDAISKPTEGEVEQAAAPKEGEPGGDNFKADDKAETHEK
jgi:hypothetical protein